MVFIRIHYFKNNCYLVRKEPRIREKKEDNGIYFSKKCFLQRKILHLDHHRHHHRLVNRLYYILVVIEDYRMEYYRNLMKSDNDYIHMHFHLHH